MTAGGVASDASLSRLGSRGGAALLLLVTLTAPLFLKAPGTVDLPIWLEWMQALRDHGLIAGYRAPAPEYPPLAFVMLFAVERAGTALGLAPFDALKLSLLGLLWLTSALVLAWTRRPHLAALAQAALLLNAVGLGYLDLYGAPFLLAALWALSAGRPRLFASLLSLSILVKWQPLLAAPFLLPCALAAFPPQVRPARRLLALAISGLAPLALLMALFGLEPLRAFERTLHHPQLSGNALNFNWLYTWALHLLAPGTFGGLPHGRVFIIETRDFLLLALPRLLFATAYAATLARSLRDARARRLAGALPLATVGYAAYFVFNPGVHENHLFVGALLALASAWLAPRAWPQLAAWVVFANVNLLLFYGLGGTGTGFGHVPGGVDLSLPLAAFGVGLFALHHWRFVWRRTPSA